MKIVGNIWKHRNYVILSFSIFLISLNFLNTIFLEETVIRGMMEGGHITEDTNFMIVSIDQRFHSIINDLLITYRDDWPMNQTNHENKTLFIIEANPFLQTINFIDSNYQIKYVSPYESNLQVIGMEMELEWKVLMPIFFQY